MSIICFRITMEVCSIIYIYKVYLPQIYSHGRVDNIRKVQRKGEARGLGTKHQSIGVREDKIPEGLKGSKIVFVGY